MSITVHRLITVLLIIVFIDSGQMNSDFELLKNDSIFDGDNSRNGNKAFLKTRLLENLNNFFPSINNEERLEILSGPVKPEDEESDTSQSTATDLQGNSVTDSPISFPTLIPRTNSHSDPLEELELATAPTTKIRSEGRITSESSLDSIRDWRKRLYKAFKNRSKISRIIRKSPSEEIVEMNDVFPTVMDKNRQIILSRTAPNWQNMVAGKQIQTYGRDQNGKLIPLFGIEPAPGPIEPYPPREIRFAYRTSSRQPVVYVPASGPRITSAETLPVPVASYLVTAAPQVQPPAPHPLQLHILPPIPAVPAPQIIYQTTPQPILMYSTFAPNSQDGKFPSSDCNGQCGGNGNGIENQNFNSNNRPESDDEKCNSQRLRTIIFNNIVSGDAEASKRAVQSSAEAETGLFFDAICGTGFFSYIAHTDEFCLASSGGVNCYVFSPVCQDSNVMTAKRKRKAVLSKN